jgi:hypothetical protein
MASTPSPLPEPQQINLQPMDQLILAAANAVNGTHPEIVAGVGSTAQNLNDAVTNTQAAAQYANVQQQVDQLHGYSAKDQQQVWDGLTQSQQASYRAAGYKPPAPHRSLWGDITHYTVDDAASAASGVFSSRPVSDVLNAIASPLRNEQHVERTLFALMNPNANTPTGGNGPFGGFGGGVGLGDVLHQVTTLHDWSKAWSETSNGEQYLLPQVKREALDKYGQQTYGIAYQLATGKSAQDLIQAVGNNPTAQQQLAVQIQSKQVQDAVNFLNSGHVSVGRMIVGQGFLARHPAAGSLLSGPLDALFDIYGDPTVVGGKIAGDANAARYLVRDGGDVQRMYDGSPSVKRAFGNLAEAVRAGPEGVSRAMDLLGGSQAQKQAVTQLIAAQADSEDKVLQYFKDAADGKDAIEGNPSNAFSGQTLPKLTKLGQARLAAKGALRDRIDWAAEHQLSVSGVADADVVKPPGMMASINNRLLLGTGKFSRMATTLVNQGGVFDPNAPDAANVLRDIALEFLPRNVANDYVYRFAQDQDIGNRWDLFRSLMLQMGDKAGLSADQDAWNTWVGKFDSSYGRIYAPRGLDEMAGDGDTPEHVGLLKNHMADRWAVPRYRDLVIQGRKAVGTKSLTGAINANWMDSFMNMWRPLTLAHPGFAIRVGGEEAFGQILRDGPVAYLRAAGARSYAKAAIRKALEDTGETPLADTTGDDLTENALAETWDRHTAHLPDTIKDGIHTVGDMLRESVVDNVRRALSATGQALAPAEYRAAVDRAMAEGIGEDGMPDELTAMHSYDPGQTNGDIDGQRFIRAKIDGKPSIAELKPGDEYKLYRPGDTWYYNMWYRALHQLASDDWGRQALLKGSYNDMYGFPGRVQRVADTLEADPSWRQLSVRATKDTGGRLVGAGQITQRQAAEDHATQIIKLVDTLTRSPDTQQEIPGLVDHMLTNGKPPTIAALEEVERKDMPYAVQGPETIMVKHGENVINRATGWLFKHQIGPQINWISRQPMWWHNYTMALRDQSAFEDALRESGMSEENVSKLVHDNARDKAIENTMKYVHNPELRSQMSTVTRNLAPFWFAQEQFYKRWARTFAYAPEAFRVAQLISQGVRHSGFTHIDPETKQEYFVYPGSDLVQGVLTDVLSRFGIQAAIPVEAGLTGQVSMLNPGLERLGLPSWGPLLNVPMDGLKQIDPHMTAAIDKIQGSVSANQGYLSAVIPSNVLHAMQIGFPQLGAQGQLASAQMQAIQYLEATGHGMGTAATTQVASRQIANPQPGDYVLEGSEAYVYQPDGKWQLNNSQTMDSYLRRVKNWSRIFLVTRAIYGFAAPAAPETQFNPDGLDTQLKTLMGQMPFDEAIATFLQEHPDATPLTVFETQSQTGSTLPATAAAMNFLDDNSKLVNDYPLAATYFIPQADTQGPYSDAGYQEQLAEGLRQKKDPSTFYNEVMYQQAARIYFQVEDQKNTMLANHTVSSKDIDDQWTQWSEQFMAANPIFAGLLGNAGTPGVVASGETGRQQIMEQVGSALQDKSTPQNGQTAALGVLYQNWVTWQQMTQSYGNPSQPAPSAAMAASVDEQFALWLSTFEQENPGVQGLVDRAIRPDLSTALNDLAAQGTVITL